MSDTTKTKDNLSNANLTHSTDDICVGDASDTVNSTSVFFDETLSAAIEAIAEATRLSSQCDANSVVSEVPDQMDPLQHTFANEVDQQQEQSTDEYLSPSHMDTSDIFSSVGMTYCVDQSQENCTLTQINTTALVRTCHLPAQSLPSNQYLTRMQANWRQTLRPVFEKSLIDRLWAQGQIGAGSPQSLLLSMWFIISRHFGVGCRTDHAKLVYDNFCIGLDRMCNSKQVQFFRDPKVRVSNGNGLLSPMESHPDQVVDMQPNCPDRCPVRLFEAFLSHRPKSATSSNSPFYLQPERTGHSCSASMDEEIGHKPVWYSPYALGKNRIGSMLNTALQSIGIPIGHQTNLSRFCDALVAAALAPASGEEGVRLTELAVQLSGCKESQNCHQHATDTLTACVSRVVDLAATSDSAIYQHLTKVCVKPPESGKPRRSRMTTASTVSSARSNSNLSVSSHAPSVRKKSGTLKTGNTKNSYASLQTCPQPAMEMPMHNDATGLNLSDHDPISYYTGMRPSPFVAGCDFENVENDEFHLKNEMMCTFENQNEVVSHQLLAQMFQDTSVNLTSTESPNSRLMSSTTSPTTFGANSRSSSANYSSPTTMILVPVNGDSSVANVTGQINNTSHHSDRETLVVDENTVPPTGLDSVDRFLSNPSNAKVETSSTKVTPSVETRMVYVTTGALTLMRDNQPTNAILPRMMVRNSPSVYPTTTTTSNSSSISSTSTVLSTGESDVHIDLHKSGAGSGRSVKLELRELLDLVLVSARTPKPTGGDRHQSGAGARPSSLTVAATSGLLRPPVGLVTQLLWRARALDDRGPWILTFSMWWLMQHYFGVGSRMHHVRLRWGHLRLVSGLRDPITDLPCEAVEYVGPAEFTTVKACAVLEPDGSSKCARDPGDHDNMNNNHDDETAVHRVRRVYPSSGWAEAEINIAAALSNESADQRPNVRPLNTREVDGLPVRPGPDFVALYKTFTLRRQKASLSADAPFYVQPLNNPHNSYRNSEAAWFSVGALGKNRIGALMRNIVDKVVRPNLPRVADAAISAARNACIAAATRAAMALPVTSESSPQLLSDHQSSQEWLLNKLSCLLGLCMKSAYALDGLGKACPQTWRTIVSDPGHHRPSTSECKRDSTDTDAPQRQVIVLTGSGDGGGTSIGSTLTIEEDVKPTDLKLTGTGQLSDRPANSVLILPCAGGVTVANTGVGELGLNSLAPVVTAQGQTPRQSTAMLTSNHLDVLNKDADQQQQCHQKQLQTSGDGQLPILLQTSLTINGGNRQVAYLDQSNTNSVGATPVKLLLLPSTAKSSADIASLIPPGLSMHQSPSLVGLRQQRQQSSSYASTLLTNTVLSSPVVIPAIGTRPLPTTVNFHVPTDSITVATTASAMRPTSASSPTKTHSLNYPTSSLYNGIPLPGIKAEQPSPNGLGLPVPSSVNTTESHVHTTVYGQADTAGAPPITHGSRAMSAVYQPQLSVTQLSCPPVASDANPAFMMISPQPSLDYSQHQVPPDGVNSTGANIFAAVYNPTTGVYDLTPATNLVALQQHQQPVASGIHRAPVLTSCDSLVPTRVLSVQEVGQMPLTTVAAPPPTPVRNGALASCDPITAKDFSDHNPTTALNGVKSVLDSGGSRELTVFQSSSNWHLGLPNSDVGQTQLQWQPSDPDPLQMLSLQSVIDSASAVQCNDFPAYVEQLFRSGVLGASRPWCLNFTVWFINTLIFGVENRTDHVNLRWGDFALCRTADGRTDYLRFYNRTHQKTYYLAASPPSCHSLGFKPEFADSVDSNTGSQVRCPCPVTVFKALRDHRPSGCLDPCSKFYLQPRNLHKTDDGGRPPESTSSTTSRQLSASLKGSEKHNQEWFTEHAWGKNKLGSLFAEAARLARLPMIWVRKHRSRNFFPGGGGSGQGALWGVQDEEPKRGAGGKRQISERSRSGDQDGANSGSTGVKRRRRSAAGIKNANEKQKEPGDLSEITSLTGSDLTPTSGVYSSSGVSF